MRAHDLKQRESWEGVRQGAGDFYQLERTLDETYYPALDPGALDRRNKQQVVTREFEQLAKGKNIPGRMKPILMVPQLWIWVVGSMVISAFTPLGECAARATGQEAPNPSEERDMWRFLAHDMPERLVHGAENPEDFAAQLLADEVDLFGDVQGSEGFQAPLDYFELGVVRVLSSVANYVKETTLTSENMETELKVVEDIADIREELAMVNEILRQQEMVLDGFVAHIRRKNVKENPRHDSQAATEVKIPEAIEVAKSQIRMYRDRVSKIDRDAERADKTVQDRLNLKRTFASIRDSRASMSDAKTSLLLAIAVIGFTVITILFAPLAFMTALFALDIDLLAKNKVGEGDDAVYPSGYIAWTFRTLKRVSLVE